MVENQDPIGVLTRLRHVTYGYGYNCVPHVPENRCALVAYAEMRRFRQIWWMWRQIFREEFGIFTHRIPTHHRFRGAVFYGNLEL